ncbi:GGDEF domain-containing protein [Paenibacillus dakarensis]|uniref:GGDEF domain-containing protein n=1 Tax=Paenibacillus dakarensis TaxID=1527293 RepID=UPI0006D52BAD|nr:GGDEF domain-containing protein [Paenibacillus dakarensis]
MNFDLDMRTAFVFLVAGHLFTIILITTYRFGQNKDQAVNAFYGAKWMQAAGWGLAMFRGGISDIFTVSVANTALFLGAALEAIALLRAIDAFHRKTLRFYIGLTTFCILAFHIILVVANTEKHRIAMGSFGMSLLLILPAVRMLTKKNGSVLMKVTGGIYCLIAVGAMIRAMISPYVTVTFFEPNLYQALSFLSIFLLMFVGNTGFVLLSKEKSDRELHKLASFDDLTGIWNRRTFILEAKKAIKDCQGKGEAFSFLLMDIDHFKLINDNYGHDTGDMVLQEYASKLKGALRDQDLLGRYGGDEFAVMLPCADEKRSDEIAENIRRSVEQAYGKLPISYTLSIGMVTVAADFMIPLDKIYKLSDKALYKAKQEGRNRAARYLEDPAEPSSGSTKVV